MPTTENLKEAFAGESQANRKYLAFAKKAEADGFPQVARLFRAAAEAETLHAHAHLRVLGGVNSTAENVAAAVEGEGYEYQQMYPKFLAEAQAEGNRAAAQSFRFALDAEKVHHDLYVQAYAAVKSGRDLEKAVIYLCPVCGNLEVGTAPEQCPICKAPKARFVEVA